MLKIIKSNIQARHASLLEGTTSVSLFTNRTIQCNAFYLMQNQSYSRMGNMTESRVLTIFQGEGELQIKDEKEILSLQATSGDIFSLRQALSYTLLNTTDQLLIATEISFKDKEH